MICEGVGKVDCCVEIIPGVGHGFSPPRGPRAHALLDLTVGPVGDGVLEGLRGLV